MLPVSFDARTIDSLIHVRHLEADHERLALAALALRSQERAAARRHWLATRLIRLGRAIEPHPYAGADLNDEG